MKVKELIEILSKFPEDTLVVTDGYENGYNDIIEIKNIKLNENNDYAWYDGKYSSQNTVWYNGYSYDDVKQRLSKDVSEIDCVYLKSRKEK